MSSDDDITGLLRGRAAGDEALYRLVYDRLRALARARLRVGSPGGTLGATDLVHEAWLRLAGVDRESWRDRQHFYAVAATAMRQIVIDYARRKASRKRGGDVDRVPLTSEDLRGPALDGDAAAEDLIALDRALHDLERLDARLCRVVEMRFFAGYSVEETASLLGTSARTVKRDWSKARALLHHQLTRAEDDRQDG